VKLLQEIGTKNGVAQNPPLGFDAQSNTNRARKQPANRRLGCGKSAAVAQLYQSSLKKLLQHFSSIGLYFKNAATYFWVGI
jgi:hypothetical protein